MSDGSASPRGAGGPRAPGWSVVIPAFDEERRLPRYLDEIVTYFEGRGEPYEVIVVDDGSRDRTVPIAEAYAAAHPAVVVHALGANGGKGAAVRHGMLAARGRLRLFADADGATPIAELKRLEAALHGGADVAIASRVLVDRSVAVVTRPHRVAAGRVFNWLVARLGLRGIADSQCGFKAFTAAAAEALFRPLVSRGFGFDVELLLRAQRASLRVSEIAVNWTDQVGSKVGVITTGPRMLLEILRARRRLGPFA
ncbi:MAG: glycosyltransferase family 2 protein [Candidatus Rokubacteria bacterium]|nr:glycosyltransferase family 2 protein [Candidatus Rokubacteria bacterium]